MNMGLDFDDLSSYPLKILWLGRFHPALHPLWTAILTPVNVLICSLFVSLAVKGVVLSYKSDIFFTAECLQTCILMLHAMGKIINFHVNKRILFELVTAKLKFWKSKNAGTEAMDECEKISAAVSKIIRFYYYLNIGVCIFFDLQPFSSGFLPTGCYIPEGWFSYLTVILWYLSVICLAGLPGTDCFFCSLAASLIIQFRILSGRIKNVAEIEDSPGNPRPLKKEIREIIDYHNFLLDYCQGLNATFTSVFLIQFMVSIASASVSVFIFMQEGEWTNRVKFLLYFLATVVQTAFYCVPLEFVASAAADLGNEMYETEWYSWRNTKTARTLTVILARSQKVLVFSAHGLIWMNLRTFVQICKTVFTFYTYLNSVR